MQILLFVLLNLAAFAGILSFFWRSRNKLKEKLERLGAEARTFEKSMAEIKEARQAVYERNQALISANKDLEDTKVAALNILEDLDITKVELETINTRIKSILASIGEGVVAIDENNNVIEVNETAETLLGFMHNEMIGKNWLSITNIYNADGKELPKKERLISKAFSLKKMVSSGPVSVKTTLYLKKRNGDKFPVYMAVSPIFLSGKIIGAVLVFRDITEELQLEKVKADFIAIASHQLRTPLTAISWYTEMLLSGDVGKITISQKKYLEEVNEGNRRMIELVNALLNVSRLEVGSFTVEPEQLDIKDFAKGVCSGIRIDAKKKNIELIENYGAKIPKITADKDLVLIILQNLLSNAVKYTPEGGKVNIDISLSGKKELLIKVSDTGIGIPEAQKNKIFQKLFRADNARVIDSGGTGLGLYIIKSVLDQTTGRIWFESVENKGTTFYISAPVNWMEKKSGTRKLSPEGGV
ncbi:MAG: PAS domain S-box protein [Candidatus Colwellbacteria bacterium]|nr:PAS domain S-box protein [Candidatus Colwellbacteria bacterium]